MNIAMCSLTFRECGGDWQVAGDVLDEDEDEGEWLCFDRKGEPRDPTAHVNASRALSYTPRFHQHLPLKHDRCTKYGPHHPIFP